MNSKNLFTASVTVLALILTGCSATSSADKTQPSDTDELVSVAQSADNAEPATPKPASKLGQPVAQLEIPVPENELTEDDYYWNQLLSRDAIFPIYEPQFAPAETAPYDDDELVIGVQINGQAKAYAIGPLNDREMVNDTVGGVPILVTW